MSSKEFTAKTFRWLYQVNWDADLLPVDVKVAVQLTCHFNEDDADGRAFPGCKHMGSKIGLSERTVDRSVRRLHKHGHLHVVWGAPGRGHSNQYWMVLKGEKTRTTKPVSTSQKTRTIKPVLKKENPHLGQRKPASGANKTRTAVTENHKENHRGNHTRARRPHLGSKDSASSRQRSDAVVARKGADAFDRFWQVYPKQVDRLAAEKAFGKALKLVPAEQIIEGAGRYARDPERIGRGERYTKHPANWLRDGSWANSNGRVTIDQHGNLVVMPKAPPPDDIDAMVTSILASGFTLNSRKD
jgi:hypothetical protein